MNTTAANLPRLTKNIHPDADVEVLITYIEEKVNTQDAFDHLWKALRGWLLKAISDGADEEALEILDLLTQNFYKDTSKHADDIDNLHERMIDLSSIEKLKDMNRQLIAELRKYAHTKND